MRPLDLAVAMPSTGRTAALKAPSPPVAGTAPAAPTRVRMRRATVASGSRPAVLAYGSSPMITESRRSRCTTVHHHQGLALGRAENTPEQHLRQRRHWGMGCMQVLVTERLPLPRGTLRGGARFEPALPGVGPVRRETVRVASEPGESSDVVPLRVPTAGCAACRAVALRLFHTPSGVVDGLPDGVPAVATRRAERRPHAPVLARQLG